MDTTALAPAPAFRLEHLSDDELLASTRCQVARANQALAALLAHLAEVEARGIHRLRACSSLYTYCIYELRMSEDAALRRAHAARIARQFPVLFEQIARGEIHLTGVLLLGPHLTPENHVEVLARAKHRTKKEIAMLVRLLDPMPDVPPRIEPLGPAAPGHVAPKSPTWRELVQSFCPVRQLEPGDRPKDWIESESESEIESESESDTNAKDSLPSEPAPELPSERASELPSGGAELGPLSPQRYKVQFTASQEYVDLLEQAGDLLAHTVRDRRDRTLEEVHLRAMRLLVDELKKRKYATTDQPDRASDEPTDDAREQEAAGEQAAEPQRAAKPRQRGRSVPAAVRRAVWKRDEGRCAYVDARGQRCRETGCLELHHEEAHARGGPPTEANLSLRCRAHNNLAAEEDFGRDFMDQKKRPRPAPARVPPTPIA